MLKYLRLAVPIIGFLTTDPAFAASHSFTCKYRISAFIFPDGQRSAAPTMGPEINQSIAFSDELSGDCVWTKVNSTTYTNRCKLGNGVYIQTISSGSYDSILKSPTGMGSESIGTCTGF